MAARTWSCRSCVGARYAGRGRSGRVEDEVGDQRRPTGLVRGTEADPKVSVEVFEEQQVVLPGRVVLEQLEPAVHRTVALVVRQPDADQPVGEIAGDLAQRQFLARSGRILNEEVRTEELV